MESSGPQSFRENTCLLETLRVAVICFCKYLTVVLGFRPARLESVHGVQTPQIDAVSRFRESVGPLATRLSGNGAVDVDVEAIGSMGDVADGARCFLGGENR